MAIKYLDEQADTPSKPTIVYLDTESAPPKPTPQQIEAMGAAGLEAERKAAEKPAIITKAPMPSKAKIEEATKKDLESKIPFDQLYKNQELFGVIKDYMKVNRNIEQGKNETDEDFAKKFMGTMREVEFNTFLGALPELNKMKNAKPEDREKMALGRELYSQTRSVFQPGGQQGVDPYLDAIKAIATDPLTYLGLGIGKLGTQAVKVSAAKEAAQIAAGAAPKGKIASMLTPTQGKVTAGVVGLEATSGAGQSVVSQRLEQEKKIALGEQPEELSAPQMILGAVLSGGGGYLEARGAAAQLGKSGKEQLADKLIKSKEKTPTDPTAPPTKTETALLSPVDENMDKLAEEFMKQEGAKVLDQISPAAALVEPAIRRDLSQRAIRVAMNIIENDPTYKVKAGQKTSTAIAEVFSAMDQGLIDDTLLEQAIRKEGLSPEQFAQANRVTVTQAAQIMQQYSTASKTLNRLRQIDPDVAKQVDALYGKPDEYTSTLGYLGGAFNRLERESKALIVSGIGTTVRNIMGSGIGLTFNSAASVIEGALMTVGKTLSPEAKGARLDTLKTSIGDTIENAFGTWGYLAKNGLASEVTDELLKHNPSIRSSILSAMQESDTDLSKFSRMVNSLNVAQDAFFRKAIFANSVEKKLKGVGLDMYQLIADGKVIPADILKEAADDTLKATFSYTPKIPKGGIKTFEGGAEAVGNYFVKAAEIPGGSLFVTFPRFMTNAIAFQYRYSPLGGIAGAEDILRGSKMLANGDEGGASLIRKGQENTAKGIVGTAALLSAIDYRENNQDVEWGMWKREDGTTVDVRGVFPLGPLLAMADVAVKHKRGLPAKTGDAFEAIIGMKMPSGTQNQFMDQLISALSSERDVEKWADKMGKVAGDFGARFVSPFIVKDIFNMVDLVREGGSVARDPNVITSEKPADRVLEAAGNRLKAKIPGGTAFVIPPLKTDSLTITEKPISIGGKETLPEAIPRVRQGPVYKEGEFFNNLVGIRITPEKTPEETELVYLGIDPYKLYGQSSGDKEYDRTYVEEANPLVIAAIQRTMMSPRYQALPEIEQKQAVENVVKNILPVARQLTDAKFMQEDLVRVYKMKFNKLTEDTRKIINSRYAAEHDGKTLEEANDYMRVPEYAARIKDLQFATGGVVAGKILKAGAKAAASGTEAMLEKIRKVKNPEAIVATEINNVVEDALNKADLTAQAIPTAPKEGAATVMAKKPYIKNKYGPAVSEPKPVDAEMEKLVTEAEASFTPPPKVEPEVVPEIKTELPMEAPTPMSPYKKELSESPNLNKPKFGSSLEVRQNALAALKDIRNDAYDKLVEMPNVAGKIEDDVIAVAQGEYRAAKGKEVDVNDPKAVEDFVSFSIPLQKKLDDLRVKYKDRPPVTLYHGTQTNADDILKTGFTDPQNISETWHKELNVGATSFTRDIRFNLGDERFGGKEPANILQTKIPYADYEFRRINMPMEQYRKSLGNGDMNTIARSITGSPTVARPLGLPRSLGLKETEDAFTESEKLALSRNMKETEKKIPLAQRQEDVYSIALDKLQKLSDNYLTPESFKPIKEGGMGSSEEAQALNAYRVIRNVIRNEFRETGGAAALKAGETPIIKSNQTTARRIKGFAKNQTDIYMEVDDFIPKVIASLEKVGNKDKAEALKVLENQFKVLRKYEVGMETPSSVLKDINREEIKAVDAIRDLVGGTYRDKETKKRIGLARGGLASRR